MDASTRLRRGRPPRAPRLAAAVLIGIAWTAPSIGCRGRPERLRIYHDPYGDVDWSAGVRLKGQHHDHIGRNSEKVLAYAAAGYDALALIDYSGAPTLSYALTERLWPVQSILSTDVLQAAAGVRVWFPSAEEVGFPDMHVDSAFLPTYIERWDPSRSAIKQPWQYETPEELFALIRAGGGLPVLAHPWTKGMDYGSRPSIFGVEIYSAFAEARRRQGFDWFVEEDRNRVLLENWDRALSRDQSLVGFAVNDHFGPLPDVPVDDDIRDSGKVIVLAKSATLGGYFDAIARGAVLAVRDMGRTKDLYPVIRSIAVRDALVEIDTDGEVTWIAGGAPVGNERSLGYQRLPPGSRYVRAEVRNGDGSVVFTQAFSVRPVGDADGNGVVNGIDREVCARVAQGADVTPDRVAACRAAGAQ
jgi:hypothetical protein